MINPAVGPDLDHLWLVGADEDHWNIAVKYLSAWEIEESLGGDLLSPTERIENPGP